MSSATEGQGKSRIVVFCMAWLETSGFWDAVGIKTVGGMAVTMLEKLAQVLDDGHWHSTAELVEQVGHRFSATLHRAVKQQGWQVERRRADARTFEYRLVRVG